MMVRIHFVCKSCGNKTFRSMLSPKEFPKEDRVEETTFYFQECLNCCEPELPDYEDVEEFIVRHINKRHETNIRHRRWLYQNFPLACVDTDEEAMMLAEFYAESSGGGSVMICSPDFLHF